MTATLIPFYEPDGPNIVMGFPMGQNRIAPAVWAYAMEKHPPSNIIELGGGNGAFTIMLALASKNYGARVWSFDRAKPDERWRGLYNYLGIQFCEGDIFGQIDRIKILIGTPGITYLLCDNGDKLKEFSLLASALKEGDIIAAHDYFVDEKLWKWSEIKVENVADTVESCALEPFMQEYFNTCGWLTYSKL